MRAYTRWATNLPEALAQMRANSRHPCRGPTRISHAGGFGGWRAISEQDVPLAFDSVTDSRCPERFRLGQCRGRLALKEMAAWFASEQKRGTDAFAIGPELFREMLRTTERVDIPLDSLEARAGRTWSATWRRSRRPARSIAPGVRSRDCVPE